jgi:hypothetical protein
MKKQTICGDDFNQKKQIVSEKCSAAPAGLFIFVPQPGVKTPGYFQARLWREIAAERHLKIARSFNCGYACPK